MISILAGSILVNISWLTSYLVKWSIASHTPPCFKLSVEVMVQGYLVYQDEWDAGIGEVLQC